MRLIDADKWINKLETQMNDKDCPSEIKDYNQLMINEIGSEPTAYDVDKVIEQLKDRSTLSRPVGWTGSYEIVTLEDAIEIVESEIKEPECDKEA